jgi:membrane dipeptidase
MEQIDLTRRMIARYPEDLAFATTAAEVEGAMKEGRIASLLGIEGGHAIENSLGALRAFHDLGVRYMTLTHSATLDWADSSGEDRRHDGLTPFGEEVVREMNRLGMLVDLSHVSPATMDDALRVTEAPIIFSHSSARAVCDHPRNVPDGILARMPDNGGVVMITFVAAFVSPEFSAASQPLWKEFEERTEGVEDADERHRIWKELKARMPKIPVALGEVADHVEHVRKVAGVDHIGLGGDYDGNDSWPEGLEDVSGYPNLFAELIRRGWSDADLAKLASGNILRVMREAEAVAARLQEERPPSTATLEELDGPTRGAPSEPAT